MTLRLHAPALEAGPVVLSGERFHYLVHVLRARAGDPVVLFDGAGHEAEAVVTSVGDRAVTLQASPPRAVAAPSVHATLILGLLKGEKMDFVVQKATELGAARIVPVAATRAVVRLPAERASARSLRWRRIAREAARQCGRADVPEIAAVTTLASALESAPPGALRLLCHERSTDPLRPLLVPPLHQVVVAIGPEGGFSADEVALARAAGFSVVGLGPRVLRAETAALAVLTIVGFTAGDLL